MHESRLVITLLKLGAYLTRTGGRLMGQYGISQQQSVILIAVDEQGPISQKEIISSLLLERSNVSKAVTILEDMGLLNTRKSEEDGRRVLVETTSKGHKMAQDCLNTYEKWNCIWLDGVSKKEINRAIAILSQLEDKN